MKTYKGFNKDMTCRGFQYEEGKSYEEKEAIICETGFHACEYPLACFKYYRPSESIFHVVEQDGKISKHNDDSKVVSTKIKIGTEISISGLVKAAIEYTKERTKTENDSDSNYGASNATGNYGASNATGSCGASSATGDCGASSATGNYGASSATGNYGASSATGDYGTSYVTGNCGVSSATGYKGNSKVDNPESIAVAWGYHSKAKGVIGSYLVFADWKGNEKNYWIQDEWHLQGAKMVRVDGINVKENVWYTLKNGELIEA